jgi:hypothetical protein
VREADASPEGPAEVATGGIGREPAVEATPESAPAADHLLERLPPDTRALEMALQRFLERIDQLGESLTGAQGRRDLLPWLTAATALAAGFEAARRHSRRRAALIADIGTEREGPALGLMP